MKRYWAEGRLVKGVEVGATGLDVGKPEILTERKNERDAIGFAALLEEIDRRVRHMCGASTHWGFPAPR